MAATQWPQQYQQYQQQPQYYQQAQQYYQSQPNGQGQHYQQSQQYQHNQQYQTQQYQHNQQHHAQQYQQFQQPQPTQQYLQASNPQSTQQYQQQPPIQQYQQASNPQSTQQDQQQSQGYSVQQYQQNRQYQPQQYGQLQHGPSTQEYHQLQKSSPTQQYSQQQSGQSQQGYHGFQHQFTSLQNQSQHSAPQQHAPPLQQSSPVRPSVPRPVAPQPYGTSKFGNYQQPYQPQRNSAHGQSPAQALPQPCFNCGNPGHFAMDCPEPIREVPAGKVNPQAFQNPLRRPKAGTTAVNQHQYTPHASHTQIPLNGYPSRPHGQTGHAQHHQYQQPCSPATPLSAQSPAQGQYYQQWQQYYQSQQGSHHQGSYQQQPSTAPHARATATPTSSQTPNQGSVEAWQYAGDPQMYKAQFTPDSATPVQFNHQSSSNNAVAQQNVRARSLTSMKSRSTPSSPHQDQALEYEVEEDDLDTLDVPDLPQTTLPFPNASQQSVNLIGQPLPGNFIVADTLEPFPPPLPQDGDCCRSKYQYGLSPEAYLENIRDSKYWEKDYANDVAFTAFAADNKVIPLDEIFLTIRQRHSHPESSDDLNRDSRNQSQTVPVNQDSLEVKMTLDRMERELAETKAKLQAKLDKGRLANPVQANSLKPDNSGNPPIGDHEIKEEYQVPPQSALLEKPIKSEQDTEDVLAALGVTGKPKPITSTTWRDKYTVQNSPKDIDTGRSRSSSRADILGEDQHRVRSDNDHEFSEHRVNGMLLRRQSCPDKKEGSPLSTGVDCEKAFGYHIDIVDRSNGTGNGYFSPSTDGQAASPIGLRTEKSFSRKRHRDDSSDEEDTPQRRQEDDCTPKNKKRQPKVAPAFGRRW